MLKPIHLNGGWCAATSSSSSSNALFRTVESYVNPNAYCPVCGEKVFYYQSRYGGRVAPHPDPALARGSDLVTDPLARYFALELGEGEKDVQRQPAHGRRGVDGLSDRDKRDLVAVEDLDQFRDIHQGA